ncbi:MAG: hypothetical protein JO317_06140 [Verrucomicrobiae bacterium]|nr:hypothetical protein [Verrucomicrobiae bacterium]
MTEPLETTRPIKFKALLIGFLGVLAAIAFLNWIAFFTISVHFGGDAIGVRPSVDGFVVKSHGHKTPVSEEVWVFSLIYPYVTLMASPAIVIALVSTMGWTTRFREFRLGAKPWLVGFGIAIWAIAWFGSITHSFVRSWRDYESLRSRPPQAIRHSPGASL